MQVHHLQGTARKRRKRVGRGLGSHRGAFSGRGVKGQKARAGARIRPGFEGGQTPLYARIPKKRGFHARAPKATVVSLDTLQSVFPAGATVTRIALIRAGVVRSTAVRIKILGDGTLTRPLTIQGITLSASAKAQIEKAGGRVVSE